MDNLDSSNVSLAAYATEAYQTRGSQTYYNATTYFNMLSIRFDLVNRSGIVPEPILLCQSTNMTGSTALM